MYSGLAALCAGLPDGRRQIIVLIAPGEPVAAWPALLPQTWIEALTRTVVCQPELPRRPGFPSGETRYLESMLRLSHSRLQASIAHMVTLGRLDGTERVYAFLSDMTRRLGRPEGNGFRVQLTLTREDIADYLGLNSETVSRILGAIKRSGLVSFESPTELLVPSLGALEDRSPI